MICLLLVNDHTAISCSGEFLGPPTPQGLADMILARPGASEALAAPLHHIDKTRAAALMPDMTRRWTCGVKLDEAEELLIGAAREGMSQPTRFGGTPGGEGG